MSHSTVRRGMNGEYELTQNFELRYELQTEDRPVTNRSYTSFSQGRRSGVRGTHSVWWWRIGAPRHLQAKSLRTTPPPSPPSWKVLTSLGSEFPHLCAFLVTAAEEQ